MSPDNCTKFTCNIKEDQTFIASEMESCPDVSECADALKYIDGCCTKCKIETLQQQSCLAESLSESATIGLIQTVIPPHGKCKNVQGIRGLTECSGNCPSGTKFNPCKFYKISNTLFLQLIFLIFLSNFSSNFITK